MTPLEIASGVVLGPMSGRFDPVGDLGPVPAGAHGVVAAMEAAVLPLLARSPCLITFSGGMDSSFVLAVALRAARRHGLPAPVPVSWRFPPDAAAAHETGRQDAVLAALGDPERQVLQAGEELDFLGPVAQEVYRRHGARFPGNLHLHAPVITAARGGSVLTGFGGDQVLGGHGPPPHDLLRSPARQAFRFLPRTLRLQVHARRLPLSLAWLTPEYRTIVGRGLAARRLTRPTDPWERIRSRCDDRGTELAAQSLADLAGAQDVRIGHPFLHPAVQDRIAAAARRTPLPRADLLRVMADGALPAIVTRRHPKARFHQVFLRSASRTFRTGWTGEGIDPTMVDPVALRAFWRAEPFCTATALLDQQLAFTTPS